RLAAGELLGYGEILFEAAVDERRPVLVHRCDAVVDLAVHLRHCRERGSLQLNQSLEGEGQRDRRERAVAAPFAVAVSHARLLPCCDTPPNSSGHALPPIGEIQITST